jgi:ribosomal protein L29
LTVTETLTVVGKLIAEEAEITLNFGYEGRVEFSKKFLLKKSDSLGISAIVPRLWASKKIDELSLIETGKNIFNLKNQLFKMKIKNQFSNLVANTASLLQMQVYWFSPL